MVAVQILSTLSTLLRYPSSANLVVYPPNPLLMMYIIVSPTSVSVCLVAMRVMVLLWLLSGLIARRCRDQTPLPFSHKKIRRVTPQQVQSEKFHRPWKSWAPNLLVARLPTFMARLMPRQVLHTITLLDFQSWKGNNTFIGSQWVFQVKTFGVSKSLIWPLCKILCQLLSTW